VIVKIIKRGDSTGRRLGRILSPVLAYGTNIPLMRIFITLPVVLGAAIQLLGGATANTFQSLEKARAAVRHGRARPAVTSLVASGRYTQLGPVMRAVMTPVGKMPQRPYPVPASGSVTVTLLLPSTLREEWHLYLPEIPEPFLTTTCLKAGEAFQVQSGPKHLPTGAEVRTLQNAPAKDPRLLEYRMARTLLAFALTASPSFPISFTKTSALRSDASVDVIHASGPNGFTVELAIDPATHLIRSMTFPLAQATLGNAHAGATPVGTMEMDLGDYRDADGWLLPHRFSSKSGGTVYEDITFDAISVNPHLSASVCGN
jgi:hypothetical protein